MLSGAAASRGRRAASMPRAAVGTGLFLKNACFEVFNPCTLVFTIEKLENIESHKEEKIAKRAKEVEDKMEEVEHLKKSQFEMLEKISGLSKEQAKEQRKLIFSFYSPH